MINERSGACEIFSIKHINIINIPIGNECVSMVKMQYFLPDLYFIRFSIFYKQLCFV